MKRLLFALMVLGAAGRADATITVTEKVASHQTILGSGWDTNDTTNTTIDAGTRTFSIANNALGVCVVLATASNAANLGTITINGGSGSVATWASVTSVSWDTIAANTKRLQAFRGLGTGDTAAQVIVTSTGTLSSVDLNCFEATNVDTTGTNGSGALAQFISAASDSATSLSSGTFPNAMNSSDNAVLVLGGAVANLTWTAHDGTWTMATKISNTSPTSEARTQYKVNTTVNAVTWSWNGAASAKASLAVEVKGPAAATGTKKLMLLGVGVPQ